MDRMIQDIGQAPFYPQARPPDSAAPSMPIIDESMGQPTPAPMVTADAGLSIRSYGSESQPMGQPPPAQYRPPDFRMKQEFENRVFEQLGYNPYTLDPYEEVRNADAKLPDLFNHIFRGEIMWADRHRLDKNQAAYWDAMVKKYHADVFEESKAKREYGIKAHEFMIGKFESVQKEYEAKMAARATPPEMKQMVDPDTGRKRWFAWDKDVQDWKPGMFAEADEAEGPPDMKEMVDPKDGKLKWFEWNKDKGEWNPTPYGAKGEKGPKEASREDLIAVHKFQDYMMGAYEPGEKLTKQDLDTINKVRERIGEPPLKETMTVKEVNGILSKLRGPKSEWGYTPGEEEPGGSPVSNITHRFNPTTGKVEPIVKKR